MARSNSTYAQTLADFALRLSAADLPPAVLHQARLSTLDFVGVALAGGSTPAARVVVDYVRSIGGNPEATVFGSGFRAPMASAAFANGTKAHTVELDDHEAHERSTVHPGVVVMPVAWAVSEKRKISGSEFLTAVVIGYDVIGRLSAAAITPSFVTDRGFHTTALFGPFASAAVAGRLLGLDPDQMANALGIVGSMCSGLFETRAAGSWVKGMHAGWSAHTGLVAAQLAAKGLTGPLTIFEGEKGLYRSFLGDGNFSLDVIDADLGSFFDISLIMYKPYACAGKLHSALTAVDEIRARNSFDPVDIEEVIVQSSSMLVDKFGNPHDVKSAPNSGAQGQFSLPYAVAVLIVDGAALIEQFTDDAVRRTDVLTIAKRVRGEVDPELDARWPREEPSRVIIRLKDGRALEATVPGGKGTLVAPMSELELRAKFTRLASPIVGASAAAHVESEIMSIDQNQDVGAIAARAAG